MTRKHFKAIAESLAYVRPSTENVEAYRQWRRTVLSVADSLSPFNANFRRATFIEACGAND